MAHGSATITVVACHRCVAAVNAMKSGRRAACRLPEGHKQRYCQRLLQPPVRLHRRLHLVAGRLATQTTASCSCSCSWFALNTLLAALALQSLVSFPL